MKRLLILFLLLLPFAIQAQVSGSIQKTTATRTIRYFNAGTGLSDSLAVVQLNSLANLDMLRWNAATLKFIPRTPAQVLSDIGGASAAGYLPLTAGSGVPLTGDLYLGVGTGSRHFIIDGANESSIILNAGGSNKWQLLKESGTNAFTLYNYTTGASALSFVAASGNATFAGTVTAPTFIGALTGNASTVTTNANLTGVVTSVGNATSFAASPTFTGTVTIPTPFTLGATSVTTTGTQLNYLNIATGTSGTGAIAYNNTPSFTTPAIGAATGSQVTVTQAASGTNAALYVLRNSGTGAGTRANINFQTGAATTSGQISVVRDASNNTTMSLTTAVTGTATNYLSVNSLGNLDFTGTTITASAAGTPVVMTAPAASGTLATLAGSEALSNKTYAGSTLLLTGTFSGADNGLVSRNANSGGTNASYDFRFNTGGTFYSGVETSAGNTIFTGANPSTAYEVVLGNQANGNVGIFANNTRVVTFAASGATTFIGVVNATNAALTTPAFTGVPTGTVTSNTYVATITDGANVGSSALVSASYIRVGNQVQVEAVVTITATLGGSTLTTFDLSLPVASNFGATTDARGGGGGSNVATGVTSHNGLIQADVANDRATFSYVSTLASPATFTVSVHFQYTVI